MRPSGSEFSQRLTGRHGSSGGGRRALAKERRRRMGWGLGQWGGGMAARGPRLGAAARGRISWSGLGTTSGAWLHAREGVVCGWFGLGWPGWAIKPRPGSLDIVSMKLCISCRLNHPCNYLNQYSPCLHDYITPLSGLTVRYVALITHKHFIKHPRALTKVQHLLQT